MKYRFFIACLGIAGLGSMSAWADADVNKGKAKAEACVSCHGVGGKSLVPTFPKLNGQHAVYLESTLKEFRSGVRKNALMSPFATGLSDEDIRDLAAYFQAQP
jgi:cytochrome c553